MNLNDRIADEREYAAFSAMKDMIEEREQLITELTCSLAEEKAENAVLYDEIKRLNDDLKVFAEKVEELEDRIAAVRGAHEQDYGVWREDRAAMERQLKGCDMCMKLDCPEKKRGWTEIPMCNELLLEGSCNG
jgi:septal ring factor EnvC (AmiA/AmiB activator)